MPRTDHVESVPIAVIGLSCRFPGARSAAEYWQNLCDGRDCIAYFSAEQAIKNGAHRASATAADFVGVAGLLPDADAFDPEFFALSIAEAERTDLQHRLFLECAWDALQDAGYDPDRYEEAIGIFAGAGLSADAREIPSLHRASSYMQQAVATRVDHLCTRVAYKLNLTGPAISVSTACSSSLAAVAIAIDSLRAGTCSMAICGGVRVRQDLSCGYVYEDGMIFSRLGRCCPFDHRADGTVPSNGVAAVVLKRLSDAISDRDHIYATVLGRGINNDGSRRVGYQAPGIDGQRKAIEMALDDAHLLARDVSFVEAHGTATAIGDVVELQALNAAFQAKGGHPGPCYLGSVKSNVGHLDAASGVAGLIKVILALYHGQLPATINFEAANPALRIDDTPFQVANVSHPLPAHSMVHRAGVSSFGIGGTNVHLVLESFPSRKARSSSRPLEILPLSARSAQALDEMTSQLVSRIEHSVAEVPDIAFTLQCGRKEFPHRRVIACPRHANGGASHIESEACVYRGAAQRLYLVLPGITEQDMSLWRQLYAAEPLVQHEFAQCSGLLPPELYAELQQIVNGSSQHDGPVSPLYELRAFVLEYSLARFWIRIGVNPGLLVGSQRGEFVAACISGTFSLSEALLALVKRADSPQAFNDFIEGLSLRAPRVPFLSTAKGAVISDLDATSPRYWQHYWDCQPQRLRTFGKLPIPGDLFLISGSDALLSADGAIFAPPDVTTLSSFSSPGWLKDCNAPWLGTVAGLWMRGFPIDWKEFNYGRAVSRVSLPGHPLQRRSLAAQGGGERLGEPCRSGAGVATADPRRHTKAARESIVQSTWCEVLGTTEVLPDSNFCDCGGDSLSAISLAGLLSARLGFQVSSDDILEAETLRLVLNRVHELGAVEQSGVDPIAHIDLSSPRLP